MDAVAARPELELHGLVVLRDGARVLEQYWAPYVADDRALVYSASKTFTASAIALTIAEGRFALDDRIVDLLPEAQGVLADLDDKRSGAAAAGSTARVLRMRSCTRSSKRLRAAS